MAGYVDAIGDRLDHPENVPPELAHLIPDDVQRVKRILDFPVSGHVLDVGCSDGAITRRISDRWHVHAVGSDIRDAHPPDGWVWDPLIWDIREPLPTWAAHFDTIYACEVFEHLTDADATKALTNVLAVLKTGGDLIVTVPNRQPADVYEVGCRSRWAWPDHRSAWTYAKLTEWLMPHFGGFNFAPLYDGEHPKESIWLIVRAKGKR